MSFNTDLAFEQVQTITLAEWKKAREEAPEVQTVQSEHRGTTWE